jgi:hypothetical protein
VIVLGAPPIWVIDASSIIAVRQLTRGDRERAYDGLHKLAKASRLFFPPEVIAELERYAGTDNPALEWAKECDQSAVQRCDLDRVKSILNLVPEVLDPDKEGTEEADVYVLGFAQSLKELRTDVRVVTEEFKTTIAKMSLSSAAGYLGIPSVSLRVLLKFEGLVDF